MTFFSSKITFSLLFTIIFLLLVVLDYHGYIWHNAIFASFYTVKGLDVSHHQGKIDWQKVTSTQRYSFVYIKATEGHDFTDDDFLTNWRDAKNNGLLVGAYHFFSIRSSGKEQADLFIQTVPLDPSALPPVIDIEIATDQDPLKIRNEIKQFADDLEKYYKKKPILYVTYDTHNAYLRDEFLEYKIWIRDVFKPPYIKGRQWLIWQYSNRGRVAGIDTYVDINVFKGTQQDLLKLSQ